MTLSNKITEIVKHRKKSLKDDWEYYNSMENLPNNAKRLKLSESIKNNRDSISIISEIKPASPTLGSIRTDINVNNLAYEMEEAGVVGLSVLTEPYYFHGSYGHLKLALSSTDLPCLMKDFIVDPIQVMIAAKLGASNALIINSICNLEELYTIFIEKGIEPLIEIHDMAEIKDIERLNENGFKPTLIGVNNRNLKTLEIDLNTSRQIIPKLREIFGNDFVIVSESGIGSHEDIKSIQSCGADAYLIGSSIMQAKNITQKILDLRGLS
ncbi:MAG: indole-3-glycerol-phosphate synthase [Promethearchaeota archaeon]